MEERTQTNPSLPESPQQNAAATDNQEFRGPQTANTNGNKKSRKKLVFAVAGTAVVALTAGILFQVFQAENTQAGVNGAPGTARVSQSPRYVARVNNELINWEEVAQECMVRYGREVLDNVINRTIVQQACKAKNIEVTEAEVTQEITEIAGRFKMPVETWHQMLLAERGLTPAQYRRDIIWPMIALKKIAGKKVQVTDQDIQRAFIRDYGPKVKVRVIMLDNIRRAQELHTAVMRKADDFERLARENSIEPNSRALDGAIPPIHRYYGNDKLEKAAFGMREGEISGIIEVGLNRYVILKCDGFTEPVVTNIAEVKDELFQRLQEERVQESIAKIFGEIKRSARVDNYLTKTSTQIRQTSGTAPASAAPAFTQPQRAATQQKPGTFQR